MWLEMILVFVRVGNSVGEAENADNYHFVIC